MTRPSRLLLAVANGLGWAADRLLTRCLASCPDDLLTNAEFAARIVAEHKADRLAVIEQRADAYLAGPAPFAKWEPDFVYDQEGDL